MADLNITNFDYALKVRYPRQRVERLFYKKAPTFALLPKWTDFTGDSMAVACQRGPLVSVSAAFSTAQTNKGHSSGERFLVTRVKKYALGGIDTETIEASKGNEGALVSASKAEMEGAIQALAKVASYELFGTRDGHIGTWNADDAASTDLQLANVEDVRNFEVGMRIVCAADAASALRDSGAVGTVAGVNRATGLLTMAANTATTWGACAAGDLIFREGDYASASDVNCIAGFASWLPGSATPAALFGVTRTTDVTRLAGCYSNSTLDAGLSTEAAAMLMAYKVAAESGEPDLIVMGMNRHRGLVNALDSKAVFGKTNVDLRNAAGKVVGNIGFDLLKLHGPTGTMDVVADPACPESKIYVLSKKSWLISSMGSIPRPVLTGGKYVKDAHDSDGVELRVGYFANAACFAPSHNGVYTFA